MAERTRVAIGSLCLLVSAALALALAERAAMAAAPPAVAGEFRVATWNIKSGDGRCPIGGACPFNDETQNCTDVTLPRNAWAYGVPQAELLAIAQDPSVLALGLQEAWNCAGAARVKAVLNWPYVSSDYNGTALAARYGIVGTLQVKLLSKPGDDQAYIIGADVCVDVACSATIRVYATHFVTNLSGEQLIDNELVSQAQGMTAWIATQPHADRHIVVGDFNAYEREVEISFPCEKTFDYRAPGVIRGSGYVDAWMAIHGTSPGMTATINKNGCGTPNGNVWKRIDYGYLKGFTPVSSNMFAVVPVNTAAPSDHYGVLTGFSGATDPVTTTTTTTTTQTLITLPAGEILLRAADDVRPKTFGRFSVAADTTANGGYKWKSPDLGEPKIGTALASPTSYFDVSFTAPAGTPYHLWLRMRAQGDSYQNDSVWVQFSDSLGADGQAAFRIGTADATAVVLEDGPNAGVAGWGWADNGYGTFGPPIAFQGTGVHTIRIQQREDGATIDEILLSPRAYFQSSPGLAKQDTTMFRATQLPQ